MITSEALKDQTGATKVFLLDVCEPKEVVDNGFIEGAVNIPIRTLTQNLDKLAAKDQPIVTYCAIGHCGVVAMITLQWLGYTNVKSVVRGFNAWKAANLPVATGAPSAPVARKAPEVDKALFAAYPSPFLRSIFPKTDKSLGFSLSKILSWKKSDKLFEGGRI